MLTRVLKLMPGKQCSKATHHIHAGLNIICKGLNRMFILSLLLGVFDATVTIGASYVNTCNQTSHAYQLRRGNSHSFYTGPIPNHVLVGQGYRYVTTQWNVTCASYCLQDDACKSFNFCHSDKRCEFNSAVYARDKSDLYPSNGCEYYDERYHTECDVSTTVGDYEPSFIKRQRDEKYRLDFAVKGATDAVVWLSEQENKDKHYEIVITGWGNTHAAIRKERTPMGQNGETYVRVEKPGLMNATEYRRFWIIYDDWEIKVGQGGQDEPFMEWTDPDRRVTVSYIGIASNSGSEVKWIFYNYCDY
ncbi:uncharacterized protein LOC117307289 [Asterias rubens]|uniref:uncharacterized protein LOC117307289 n=1 Tax=Asterias rubens TaxID=7604 RepID=UPI001455BD87|nr:uncharacterized protein LOC117307289 [Asterias rubens]